MQLSSDSLNSPGPLTQFLQRLEVYIRLHSLLYLQLSPWVFSRSDLLVHTVVPPDAEVHTNALIEHLVYGVWKAKQSDSARESHIYTSVNQVPQLELSHGDGRMECRISHAQMTQK